MTDLRDINPAASRTYYPALDGLRGMAILLVLCYHNFNYLQISKAGWIGVDLFFVLSGFLITGILLREKGSHHFLAHFYTRRILRIFPIYYLSLLAFIFLLPRLIKYPIDLHFYQQNQQWFWLYLQNWFFIFTRQFNNHFLDHFWSLALEEQYYLVWPCLILLIKTPGKIISVLLSVLSLLVVARIIVWLFQFPGLSYISLYKFSRIDGLCIGSLLACFFSGPCKITKIADKIRIAFILLSILVILPGIRIIFHSRLPYFSCCVYPGIAILFGLLTHCCLDPEIQNPVSRFFNKAWIKFIGKISYGLYLVHWPIYQLVAKKTADSFSRPANHFLGYELLVSMIATAVATIVAVISYYCIEVHFLKLKRFFIKEEIPIH